MSRDWQPGDVAICTSDGDRVIKAEEGGWHHPGYKYPQKLTRAVLRPLVVIDPEDAEAVELLARVRWQAHVATDGGVDWESMTRKEQSRRIAWMWAALREFANPTPPKCPASLTLGRSGAMYHCSLAEAHTGPHADADMLWSAVTA